MLADRGIRLREQHVVRTQRPDSDSIGLAQHAIVTEHGDDFLPNFPDNDIFGDEIRHGRLARQHGRFFLVERALAAIAFRFLLRRRLAVSSAGSSSTHQPAFASLYCLCSSSCLARSSASSFGISTKLKSPEANGTRRNSPGKNFSMILASSASTASIALSEINLPAGARTIFGKRLPSTRITVKRRFLRSFFIVLELSFRRYDDREHSTGNKLVQPAQ